jgi:hypothetical protein
MAPPPVTCFKNIPCRQSHRPRVALRHFASLYALVSGVVFISIMGLLLSLIAHRVLHKFHLDDEDMNEKKPPANS